MGCDSSHQISRTWVALVTSMSTNIYGALGVVIVILKVSIINCSCSKYCSPWSYCSFHSWDVIIVRRVIIPYLVTSFICVAILLISSYYRLSLVNVVAFIFFLAHVCWPIGGLFSLFVTIIAYSVSHGGMNGHYYSISLPEGFDWVFVWATIFPPR